MTMMILLIYMMILGGTDGDCAQRYALTHNYDPVEEVICLTRTGIDYERSHISIMDAARWTGSIATTPLQGHIRVIVSREQYDEIMQYYTAYREMIRGAQDNDSATEREMYITITKAIINP